MILPKRAIPERTGYECRNRFHVIRRLPADDFLPDGFEPALPVQFGKDAETLKGQIFVHQHL